VEECLLGYKFNEAANSIYEFIWHEFCDWYIEISKSAINERATQLILYKVLEKSLRMLHPFMPFITEEIWQSIPRSKDAKGESIMVQPWPHIQKKMISAGDEREMKSLIDLISAIRNIRAAWNIEPKLEVRVLIRVHGKAEEALISDNEEFIRRLSRLSGLEVGKVAKPKNSAAAVVGSFEVYVPLEGLIDLEKEKIRLKKEEERISGEVNAISARLKDKNFTGKAPKDVVEKQKTRMGELKIQIEKLKDNLKNIG
jgi:valyl-tRNA synthetase